MLEGWVPSDFVSMAEQVSWPVCAVIVGFLIRPTLLNGLREGVDFVKGLKKFNIKGMSFENGGQTAQAIAAPIVDEPKNLLVFKEHLEKRSSDYSESLKDMLSQNYAMYGLSEKDEIKLLKCDLSVSIAERMYMGVCSGIYLSQINLIKLEMSDGKKCSYTVLDNYFNSLKSKNKFFYEAVNVHVYIGYLISMNLVESDGDSYSLTKYGKGFLEYVNNNPQVIGGIKSV
jgi:hypothetical protein